ncbi:MAG: hypothetical protein ACUVX8_10310 [Candidatus Zipacnadales bacterium]
MLKSSRDLLMVVLGLVLLQMGMVRAQEVPPAKAPTPPQTAQRGDAEAPPLPAEALEARRLRADALREQWQAVSRNQIQMIAVAENIAILYGTYLCLFDGTSLELKAKVDLREILQIERKWLKEQREGRLEKLERGAEENKAEPVSAAEEQ